MFRHMKITLSSPTQHSARTTAPPSFTLRCHSMRPARTRGNRMCADLLLSLCSPYSSVTQVASKTAWHHAHHSVCSRVRSVRSENKTLSHADPLPLLAYRQAQPPRGDVSSHCTRERERCLGPRELGSAGIQFPMGAHAMSFLDTQHVVCLAHCDPMSNPITTRRVVHANTMS